mmetsp:Transcript_19674/g.46184  ORF Transcript_19674/g.46184 Transcript_19674/m.46184 type:complete len:123 (+) Transcript_19674:598-966(+)
MDTEAGRDIGVAADRTGVADRKDSAHAGVDIQAALRAAEVRVAEVACRKVPAFQDTVVDLLPVEILPPAAAGTAVLGLEAIADLEETAIDWVAVADSSDRLAGSGSIDQAESEFQEVSAADF